MTKETELSIITINYNGATDTCELLDTIPREMEGLEVLVVDNGSSTDEASIISQRYPWVRIIRSKKNLGFAGGNNLGINNSHGKYLYFLNNDTILAYPGEKETALSRIQRLKHYLDIHTETGMVCPLIRYTEEGYPVQWVGYTPLSHVTVRNKALTTLNDLTSQPHYTPYAHGAAMMVRRSVVEEAGLMPELYFLYYEELDWSLRIREMGYNICVVPESVVYHKESRTTGRNSALKSYYLTRNRLLFAHRNGKGWNRELSLAYQLFLAAPLHIFRHLLFFEGKWCRSIIQGIADYRHMALHSDILPHSKKRNT